MAGLKLVTGPSVEPVTLSEAKTHMRVDHDDEDSLISALIVAARERIDGKEGILNRAIIQQTWELTLDDEFPDEIEIPLPPLQSVSSITYVDTDGDTQTLAADQYRVIDSVEPARIVPANDVTWPTPREQTEAIMVKFVAGHEDSGASPQDLADNVPQVIKQAILLTVSHWYEHREAVHMGTSESLPMGVDALLWPLRIRYSGPGARDIR